MSPPQISSEGSLEAPERHPIDWQSADFYDEDALFAELERVYDICHGCRRCFSLCNAFPTLFDLVDESATFEVDGVAKEDYWKVVDHCYLCDMCFMTKCPYVPPHEWNVDFPHLMLRAKAVKNKQQKPSIRDRFLSSTDAVGKLAAQPVLAPMINTANKIAPARVVLEKALGVHRDALLPEYQSKTLERRYEAAGPEAGQAQATQDTRGRVALFATCYANVCEPSLGEDLLRVFHHNEIPTKLATDTRCCGMPKLELGDLEAVARAKEENVPMLAALVNDGWDLVSPIPSCVLMFKQELPLMFPDDEEVKRVAEAFFDPCYYLILRHREGKLNVQFPNSLGRVSYHVACHQRVQNIGLKTKELLELVPDTEVDAIERCSGHDGTYAVKVEFHEHSMNIAKPVVKRVRDFKPDHFTSDCAMAGHHIENGLDGEQKPLPPLSLIKKAYGI